VTTGADLTEIQNAVSGILDQHGILVAAGPLGAGLTGRLITKNKVISNVLMGGGALVAVQQLSGPCLHLMKDQFGYLGSLLGS